MRAEDLQQPLQDAVGPIVSLLRQLREEVAEIRDLSLVAPVSHTTAAGFDMEMAVAEMSRTVEELIKPIHAKLDSVEAETTDLGKKVRGGG